MDLRRDATSHTRAHQASVAASLPPEDGSDQERTHRGFIATLPDAEVGRAWTMKPYAFLQGDPPPPPTVNPSLWRQAQLNLVHGLFEVTPGIYQVRGFDISNVTFIEGKTGYIVVDPLTSAQPAAAALKLLREHRGHKPVTAVIYTHSHVDHFGGVRGVITDEDLAAGVEIVAPEGFLKAAVSENVLLGNAMGRRATYMYGGLLASDVRGHVDSGLGKAVSRGAVSLIPPTRSVIRTGEELTLDGVRIEFQLTPDTEAPAEMNFFFSDFGALCMAENCTCHLHNLYTPRGAQVRDALAWSRYIDEAADIWADRTTVVFASHHWPRWGSGDARVFLAKQRDLYKYVHDQTLRLANHGLTPLEISETLDLPSSLREEWYTRDYYGTLSHNAKAVYQRYLGWFDGNPAHLNPLPPVEAGRRYVTAVGGSEALLGKAQAAFDEGDYRWVAELLNHLVFSEPENLAARELQAATFEQLGYQAESGPWRDFYLTGAQELRSPRPPSAQPRQGSSSQLKNLPADALLESLSIRLDGRAAARDRLKLTLRFTDVEECYDLRIENAVLHHRRGASHAEVQISRSVLIDLVFGEEGFDDAVHRGAVVGPASSDLATLLSRLDRFDFWFNIVEP